MLRPSMILLAMLAGLAATSGLLAAADQQVAQIGDMTIRTDAARWRVTSASSDELLLAPTGSIAGKHDAIRILRRTSSGIGACAVSARQNWPATLYNEPRLSVVAAAGRDWRRIDTHTRCRNATPTGVMLCTVHDGNLYTLALLNRVSTCRTIDGVLFSKIGAARRTFGRVIFHALNAAVQLRQPPDSERSASKLWFASAAYMRWTMRVTSLCNSVRCNSAAMGMLCVSLLYGATASSEPTPSSARAGVRACSDETKLRSKHSKEPTKITFVNKSGLYRGLYWIDFKGQQKSYGGLKPRRQADLRHLPHPPVGHYDRAR